MTEGIFSTEDLKVYIKQENNRLKKEYGTNYKARLNIGLWDAESRLKERQRLKSEVETSFERLSKCVGHASFIKALKEEKKRLFE